jgi:HK97 family phage prohead protease
MERKTVEIIKEEDGWVVASTPSLDRDKDRVLPMGLDVSSYQKNPVIMWGHDYSSPFAVIGKAADMMLTPDAFKVKPEFREPASDSDPMHIIKALWDSEMVRAFSIGFNPQEWEDNDEGGRDFTRAEILEISLVPIGANQEALRLALKALDKNPYLPECYYEALEKEMVKTLDEQQEFERELEARLDTTDAQPAEEPTDADTPATDDSAGTEQHDDETDEGETTEHNEPDPMSDPRLAEALAAFMAAVGETLT